jgi:ABC-type nickel/cobalt efflux system permease component RcnA
MKRISIVAAVALALGAPALAYAASSPFGIATPDSPIGNGIGGPAAPLLLEAIRLQSLFYQKLTGALDTFSSDPHAGLWLVCLSFLYGIFHAVGPGHGKTVISTYVLATGEKLVQATVMSLIASFLQAISAIAIIFAATTLFEATATEITSVTDKVEIGSYALVTILGLTLAASRGRKFAREWRQSRQVSSSFICDDPEADFPRKTWRNPLGLHRHGVDCGCFEAGRMVISRPRASVKERLQAVVSIGVRPCSGALIVLVFALSRHLALAGIMSVFAMAAGTAFTVAVVACLSVMARGVLVRLASSSGNARPWFGAGAELVAACVVFLFGLTMLTGTMAVDGLL